MFGLVGGACANAGTSATGVIGEASSSGGPHTLLEEVIASGVLRVATDPNYPPQSSYNETTGHWQGFDVDVATEIARRLGVKVKWETPAWDTVIAGHWDDRWDLSVGSVAITAERAQVLHFSSPYYYAPAGLAVRKGSPITSLSQLAGKTVGVCGGCSDEYYLERRVNIPGYRAPYVVPRSITMKTYAANPAAIQDLVGGRLDAAMSTIRTLQGAIDDGKPIRLLGDPVFYEPMATAADESSSLDPTSFIARVSSIIDQMHQDGTLTRLSIRWYGTDLTSNPFAG